MTVHEASWRDRCPTESTPVLRVVGPARILGFQVQSRPFPNFHGLASWHRPGYCLWTAGFQQNGFSARDPELVEDVGTFPNAWPFPPGHALEVAAGDTLDFCLQGNHPAWIEVKVRYTDQVTNPPTAVA